MSIFKTNSIKLINPVNLERDSGDKFQWCSTNSDAQLTIDGANQLAGGWVRLTAVIQTEIMTGTPVVIYEDVGDGFSEISTHYLTPDSNGRIDFSWYLPTGLVALRFDPVGQVLRFTIAKFKLTQTSRVSVVVRSAWRVLTQYPGGFKNKCKSAFRLYKSGGLRATVTRLVSANSELARNPFLGSQNSAEQISRLRSEDPARLAILSKYTNDAFARSNSKVTWQSHFVPKAPDPIRLKGLPVQIVAFYLPQFHPFPENDAWWGKGFTEWTNVSKAQPQYLGHHQPRLPGEMGYYDLRLPQVMRQQIDLALHYGVTAFCFHHYWFGGKRLMERPVNQFLDDSSLNIDFCLCWANENWTRRWDGLDSDVLIAQNHSPEDDIAFLEDILPALIDPRYIKVDGKPFLIVYRAGLLPDAAATAARWRERAVKAGLPGLYIVAARTLETVDPMPFGFDATVEFPPHQVPALEITEKKTIVNPSFAGKIYDYKDFSEKFSNVNAQPFTNYKTVMPSWDNEARKPGKGFIFDGAEPGIYAQWLANVVGQTKKNKPGEKLVFINAWNEWAEGAHLEPDRHFGYAYLHATANVLRNFSEFEGANELLTLNDAFAKKHSAAIVLHLYYEDLIDPIFTNYLTSLQDTVDLVVTTRPDISTDSLYRIKRMFPNVYFLRTTNRGRDIRPFIEALRFVDERKYEYVCKIHTKKSLHRDDGAQWRDELFKSLVGSVTETEKIISKFDSKKQLGLLVPRGSITDLSIEPINLGNRKWLDRLFKRLGTADLIGSYETHFPAGSMYWARVAALSPLMDQAKFNIDEFELEAGQLDGTLAHAVERVVGLVVAKRNFSMEQLA